MNLEIVVTIYSALLQLYNCYNGELFIFNKSWRQSQVVFMAICNASLGGENRPVAELVGNYRLAAGQSNRERQYTAANAALDFLFWVNYLKEIRAGRTGEIKIWPVSDSNIG